VLAGPGAGDDMLGMHSAGCQDRDDVDVLSRQELADIVTGGDTELRCHRIGARTDRIADRDKTGPADMIAAQQLGVTLGNSSTSKQAKSDHTITPDGGTRFRPWPRARYGAPRDFYIN
jgi:hypothetical protein